MYIYIPTTYSNNYEKYQLVSPHQAAKFLGVINPIKLIWNYYKHTHTQLYECLLYYQCLGNIRIIDCEQGKEWYVYNTSRYFSW